jgi:alanine racemase
MAGTHTLIDLDAYARNIRALRALLAPGTALMAVVKADAYGHGAARCGVAAVEAGADWLGVARIQEALYLRLRGVAAPIMVIGPPNDSEIQLAVQDDITLSVGTERALESVRAAARGVGKRVGVHLKVDTGMHRYGVLPEEAADFASRIARSDAVELEGVYSHFSSADDTDATPTDAQIARFNDVVQQLDARQIRPRYRHLANSAAVLAGRMGPTNLVRCGIATYGLSPSAEVAVDERFQPVLTLRSVVTRRFTLPAGEGVSYGLTYRAATAEPVAAVAIGYADGMSRLLANRGWFTIGGARAPIRGRVCMDQTVVAAPGAVTEGDIVTVYGDGRDGAMTLDDAAQLTGTNNYELATRVMARVPRIYMRAGRPVAWEHVLLGESGDVNAHPSDVRRCGAAMPHSMRS